MENKCVSFETFILSKQYQYLNFLCVSLPDFQAISTITIGNSWQWLILLCDLVAIKQAEMIFFYNP